MRKLTTLFFLLWAVVIYAQQITPDEAAAIASEFLNSPSPQLTTAKRISVKRAKAKSDTGDSPSRPYYVFNGDDNHGFVIVSGDKRAKKILGYSDSGNFDFDNLPPQLAAMLEQYAELIKSLPESIVPDVSWNTSTRAASNNEGVLLETANWGQGYPYNAQCPVIDGVQCPTGCTNTAVAILMKYHNWPEHGNGIASYRWNNKTLTADLSQSIYQWDKLKNSYEPQTYTEKEVHAIASLMRDIGYTNKTDYNLSGSGACYSAHILNEYFDYAPKYKILKRKSYTYDILFGYLTNEINNNRPVLVTSGYTPVGVGAHAYVCDGYEGDEYLHFNFGWEGGCNGFYSIDINDGFAGLDIEFLCEIEPNSPTITEQDCLILSINNWGDFRAVSKNRINCEINIDNGMFKRTITFGIAIENIETNELFIQEVMSWDWRNGNYIQELELTENVPDGEYIVYPIFRFDGLDWEKCEFGDYQQSFVRLSVLSGEKSLHNPDIDLPLDSGKVEIDNVYYILDDNNNTATVTFRNVKKGSYSGTVNIPTDIVYSGKTYSVIEIGPEAFADCILDKVILPATIEKICSGAFLCNELHYINIDELLSLREIEGWAISCDMNLEELRLPPCLTVIGTQALNLWNVKFIDIPKSVKSIGHNAIRSTFLQNVQVNWDTPMGYEIIQSQLLRNIYIPEGTKEKYLNHFNGEKYNFVEGKFEKSSGINVPIYIEGVNYILDKNLSTAFVTYGYGDDYINPPSSMEKLEIPNSITYDNTTYSVKEIGSNACWDKGVIDEIILPNTIEDIGESAFDNKVISKVNLNQLNLLKRIGSRAFTGFLLQTLILPSNLEYIGQEAFSQSHVELVSLPKALKHIGYSAFAETKLQKVIANWDNLEAVNVDDNVFDQSQIETATLFVPKGKIDIYSSVSPWSEFGMIKDYQDISDILLYTNLNMQPKDQNCVFLQIYPDYDKKFMWTSSNKNIATVDQNGLVTAIAPGEAVITVTSYDKPDMSASCIINVMPRLVDAISITPKTKVCTVDEIFNLTAIILPENATNKKILWSSSDETVVSVDAKGQVTALAVGEATITATAADGSGVSASCHVTVIPILAESLTLSATKWNGEEGKSFTIVATVLPENTTDKTVSWSSSDPEIATVDAEGHVSVLKAGYCTITASTQDGSDLAAECIITIATGIDNLFTDSVVKCDVYTLQGVLLKKGCSRNYLRQLSTGAYILRQGNISKKVIIQ